MSKKLTEVDINSSDERILDFFKKANDKSKVKAQGVYAPCLNPHNVKIITNFAIKINKNPLWDFIYQDLLEKVDCAIEEGRNLTKKDVYCITSVSTDLNTRVVCLDDFISDFKNSKPSPTSIQKILAYAPKEYQNKILLDIPWNTPIQIKEQSSYLFKYAVKNNANGVISNNLKEISLDEMKQILSENKVIQEIDNPQSRNSYDTIWNVQNLSYMISSLVSMKLINEFLVKFNPILDENNKKPFVLSCGSKMSAKFEKVKEKIANGEKILAKDFSKDEFEFVKILDSILTIAEKNEIKQNTYNKEKICSFLSNGLFISDILNCKELSEKFNSEPKEPKTKNKKSP